jgi:hypothetical protein
MTIGAWPDERHDMVAQFHEPLSLGPSPFGLPSAPPLGALEYGGVCNFEHSGDGPNAQPLLSKGTYSCIKFLAKCFGMSTPSVRQLRLLEMGQAHVAALNGPT